MLQYRRRNSSTSLPLQLNQEVSDSTFLAYCNWSYSLNYQINITKALNMLNNFDDSCIPYYIRIFNEMPSKVLNSFLEKYNISKVSVAKIRDKLMEETTFRIKSI